MIDPSSFTPCLVIDFVDVTRHGVDIRADVFQRCLHALWPDGSEFLEHLGFKRDEGRMRVAVSLPEQVGHGGTRRERGLNFLEPSLHEGFARRDFCPLFPEKVLIDLHGWKWWNDGPTHIDKAIVGLGKVQYE